MSAKAKCYKCISLAREDKLSGELIGAEYVLCVIALASIDFVLGCACRLRPHLAQMRQLGLRRSCDSPGCKMKI